MKTERSGESARLRRDLAGLLKRLRYLRREHLSPRELRRRVTVILDDAGPLSHFVIVDRRSESAPHEAWRLRLDKTRLEAAAASAMAVPIPPAGRAAHKGL